MSMIDYVNSDPFSLTSLTAAINDIKEAPGMLNNSGLFNEQGVNTTTIQVEKDGETLALVESRVRGSAGAPVAADKRTMTPFNTLHLPQQATIMADEVRDVRAFGSETQEQMIQRVIDKRLRKMKGSLDATIEHLKVGALTGILLDADGTTPLLNVYDAFGMTQQTFFTDINTAGTDVIDKCRELWDTVEDEMDGVSWSGIRVYCGRNFYNKFVGHPNVEAAYERWNAGQFLRGEGNMSNFTFGEIEFVKYRGQVGGNRFLNDDDAYAVATGSDDLFIGRYAFADYMETVNTEGLPYYAKSAALQFDKGIAMESQSNPIFLCTRPQAVIKLSAAAS